MRETLSWRKSSYSGSNGGNCVEIAWQEHRAGVRDSKAPTGGALWFPSSSWRVFLSQVR